MSKLQKSWRRLRKLGPKRSLETVLSVVEDGLFIRRYRSDTSKKLQVSDYDPSLKHLDHAVPYQPARARPFLLMMQQLELPDDSVFVDIGCGKGRVLLLASRYPFKRLVGIDLSPELCAIAERNMALLPRVGSDLPYEIHAEDVTEYDFKADENVYFLYNPFDETIMAAFLEALEKSLHRDPRQIWLIYLKPMRAAREVIDQCESLQLNQRFIYGDSVFLIYCSRDTDTLPKVA